MKTTNAPKLISQALFDLIPADRREGYAPRPVKARKVATPSPRKHWIEATADYKTAKDRIADHSEAIDTGRVVLLSGLTRTDSGAIFDATEGRAVLEDLSSVEASGVAWKTKSGKVRHYTAANVVGAVAAALARLQDAKESGDSQAVRDARRDLSILKAA